MTALDTYAHRVHVGPQIFARLVHPTTMQACAESSPGPSITQQNLLHFTPSAKCAERTKRVRERRCIRPGFERSLASFSPYCFCPWNTLLDSPFRVFSHASVAWRQNHRQSSRWHRFALRHARPPTAWPCATHPAASQNSRPYQKKMSCTETSHTSMGHAHGQVSRSSMGSLPGITFVSSRDTTSLTSPTSATPCVNQTPDSHRSSSTPLCSEDSANESRQGSFMGVEHPHRQCRKTVAQDEIGGLRKLPRHL